jgi:hypothetical protein
MLHLAHDEEYVSSFLDGCLSSEQQRRIGLNDTVQENVMINRTLWEVSGGLPAVMLYPRCLPAAQRYITMSFCTSKVHFSSEAFV